MGKVPLIALTATARKLTRLKIMRSLEMHEPALLMESPNRHNICYAVRAVTPDPAKPLYIVKPSKLPPFCMGVSYRNLGMRCMQLIHVTLKRGPWKCLTAGLMSSPKSTFLNQWL